MMNGFFSMMTIFRRNYKSSEENSRTIRATVATEYAFFKILRNGRRLYIEMYGRMLGRTTRTKAGFPSD